MKTKLAALALFSLTATLSSSAQSSPIQFQRFCIPRIVNQAGSPPCLEASSDPTLGLLYPISQMWFVGPTGKIGFGTTSPTYDVEINNGTDGSNTLVGIKGSNPNASALELSNTNSSGHTYLLASWGSAAGNNMPGNFSIHDSTAGGHRLVIRGNGFVGLGVDTPTQKLHVSGNILATGSITEFSDRRFKTDMVELQGALASVLKLRGVEFDWRREEFPEHGFSDARQIGFIAQEVKEVVPEIVVEGSDGYLSVDYAKLTPLLVEAIQTQEEELAELRRANEELGRRIARLDGVEARLQRMEGALATLAGPK